MIERLSLMPPPRKPNRSPHTIRVSKKGFKKGISRVVNGDFHQGLTNEAHRKMRVTGKTSHREFLRTNHRRIYGFFKR
jgi:hypothetical protein